MHVCYLDESGDFKPLPLNLPPIGDHQPVFVLSGLIVNLARLETLTNDFLTLKHRFFPGLPYPSHNHLDRIIPEIKGVDVRRHALRGNRNQRRQSYGFIDKVIGLLEANDVRLVTRIWIKPTGGPFDGRSVYTSSVQAIYSYLDHFLTEHNDFGFGIADSRTKTLNVNVSHSIFTQKFQSSTDFYSHILELPTFGHSDNHAGLQLCDLVCSAVLYPIACQTYCTGTVANVHVQPTAAQLKDTFGTRLKNLQYRYQDPISGKYKGGITVSDPAGRNSSLMFK